MRRLLVLLLLAVLPLQFSWAAVTAYCGNGEPANAAHFGHHLHDQHAGLHGHAEQAASADAQAAAVGEIEPANPAHDCGHCQAYGGVALPMSAAASFLPTLALPRACADEAFAASAPTRPERPQWLPLA